MKKLGFIIFMFAVLAINALTNQKDPRVPLPMREGDFSTVQQIERFMPTYSFAITPVSIVDNYYDYFPGSYTGKPVQRVSTPTLDGNWMVFHTKTTSNSSRRIYKTFIDDTGTIQTNFAFGTDDLNEGYPGMDVTADGRPILAYHVQADTDQSLEVVFGYDAVIAGLIYGMNSDAFTIIDNDTPIEVNGVTVPSNEFIWPSVQIGPSPLVGYQRVYILGKNATTNGSAVSENVIIYYNDFTEENIEYQMFGNTGWSSTSIPTMNEWNVSMGEWRRPYMSFIAHNDKIYYIGCHLAYSEQGSVGNPLNEGTTTAFVCDNYGEGTWTQHSTFNKFDIVNPKQINPYTGATVPGTGIFLDGNIPYPDNQLHIAIGQSGHFSTSIDNEGRIHFPAFYTVETTSGSYYPDYHTVKQIAFDTNTLEWEVAEVYPQLDNGTDIPNDPINITNYNGANGGFNQGTIWQSWDQNGDGLYDQILDDGTWDGIDDNITPADTDYWGVPLRDNIWPYMYWDNNAADNAMMFHLHTAHITDGNEQDMMAMIWQDSQKSRNYNMYPNDYPELAPYQNMCELVISVSADNGRHWSEPIFLNGVDTPEMAGQIPEFPYLGNKVDYLGIDANGDKIGRVYVMYLDDYTYGSSVQNIGMATGGSMEFMALDIVFADAPNHVEVESPSNLTASVLSQDVTLNWLAPNVVLSDGTTEGFATTELKSPLNAEKAVVSKRISSNKPTKTPNNISTRTTRVVTGYKIYRNAQEIATVGATAPAYIDAGLDNGSYHYYVTAMHGTQESNASNSVSVVIDVNIPGSYLFEDSFETYTNFALEANPWIFTDIDQSPTSPITNISFPNSGSSMAYIVFNPSQTTPPVTGGDAHSGNKYLASFASVNANNNDWLISPSLEVGSYGNVTFWARSYTTDYGMERFKVHVSTGSAAINSFTQISTGNYTQVGNQWTQFFFNLDNYIGENVRIAIQCVSSEAFIFMVDDFKFATSGDITNYTTITGQLVSHHDNIGIEGEVSIQGPTNFQVNTDINGNFIIENIPKHQTYTLSADAPGHQTYTTQFVANNSSLDLGILNLVELTNPPTQVVAQLNENVVNISWVAPSINRSDNNLEFNNIQKQPKTVSHQNSSRNIRSDRETDRVLIGFNVYRFLASNLNNQSMWSLLNQEMISVTNYTDSNISVLNGNYKYAVKAVYSGDRLSQPGTSDTVVIINDIINPPQNLVATVTEQNVTLNWLAPSQESTYMVSENTGDRDLTGYKIYRDTEQIAEIGATALTYTDSNLANGTYEYHATAMYGAEESLNSNSVTATIYYFNHEDVLITDSFETYQDFALEFGEWTLVDIDSSPTYAISSVSFTNSESPMAYIVFNPATTVPPLQTPAYVAADGSKYLVSLAAVEGPNDDWLVSKPFTLGEEGSVNFSAKSLTAAYGLERFNVLVSRGSISPNSFTRISGTTFVEPPTEWTNYSYSLNAYADQTIRVAVQCVSNESFAFMLDNIKVVSAGGTVNNDTPATVAKTILHANYPNPFNPETTISYSVEKAGTVTIEVYNILGQKVKTLINTSQTVGPHTIVWNGTDDNGKSVSSGVYFYRMKNGSFSKINKMLLMK